MPWNKINAYYKHILYLLNFVHEWLFIEHNFLPLFVAYCNDSARVKWTQDPRHPRHWRTSMSPRHMTNKTWCKFTFEFNFSYNCWKYINIGKVQKMNWCILKFDMRISHLSLIFTRHENEWAELFLKIKTVLEYDAMHSCS